MRLFNGNSELQLHYYKNRLEGTRSPGFRSKFCTTFSDLNVWIFTVTCNKKSFIILLNLWNLLNFLSVGESHSQLCHCFQLAEIVSLDFAACHETQYNSKPK